MARRDETTKYSVNPVGASIDDDFSLEDILAEYGGGRESNLMRDVETELDPLAAAKPKAEKPLPPTPKHREPPPAKEPEPPELPKAPKPITLEEVVGSTVSAVMEEQQEPLMKPRRGLFSRRKLEETEQLYDAPEPKEEPVAEPIGPEPELWEAAAECKAEWQSGRGVMLPALLMALVPTVLLLAEQYGNIVIPMWTGDYRFQSIVLLVCLAVTALLCRQVFVQAVKRSRSSCARR